MTGTSSDESELSEALRQLGENLKITLQSAWESDERKRVQDEIEIGLQDLRDEIQKASEEFNSSQLSQDIKTGANDLNQRIQSGELGEQVRQELLKVLNTINSELKDVQSRWTPSTETDASASGEGKEPGEEA